MVNPLVCVDYC